MINQELAIEQLERLKQLDWYPVASDKGVLCAGEKDLVLALMAAATDSIAIAAVNNWVGYSKECPKPAELRKYIWDENEKVKPPHIQRAVQFPPRVTEKQNAAAARYMELIQLQREERRLNPKLAEIGSDGMCPRTAITQEMESKWAEAGMGHR